MLENYYRELVCFLNAQARQSSDCRVKRLSALERSSDTPIKTTACVSLSHGGEIWSVDDHRRNALRQVESLDVLDNEERYFTPSPHSTLDHDQRLEMPPTRGGRTAATVSRQFSAAIEGLSHPEIAERLGISRSAGGSTTSSMVFAHVPDQAIRTLLGQTSIQNFVSLSQSLLNRRPAVCSRPSPGHLALHAPC